MKKFICKSLLLVAIFAVFYPLVIFGIPKDRNSYLCEYNHKVHLLETVAQPRIIFIGGSNIAFGMDSKMLSDSLRCNVVNFGLHAGIGLRFPLEDCLQYVRKGDIVVLQFEYANFFDGGNGNVETFLPLMLATDWRNAEKLNGAQWMNIIRGVPLVAKGSINRLRDYPKLRSFDTPADSTIFQYVASGFNEYGDEIGHFVSTESKYRSTKKEHGAPQTDFMNWLDYTTRQYEQAGARVIMLPPVCLESYFQNVYNDHIEKALNDIHRPYIVAPSAMVLDDSCAFNTGYHVNRVGCYQNTQNIIRYLKAIRQPSMSN